MQWITLAGKLCVLCNDIKGQSDQDFSSHLRLLFCLQNSREGTVLGRIRWRGEQCPLNFYILLLPRRALRLKRGDNGFGEVVWKFIFYPINAFASTIIDFCSTAGTFPIKLIFLVPLLVWFSLLQLEPAAKAEELHKFDFFLRNQITAVHSCHVKADFCVVTKKTSCNVFSRTLNYIL